jgi:hypothetical protein
LTADVTRDENVRDLNQGKKQAMLLVHIISNVQGNTLFNNSQTARRCGGVPSCMNHK